MNNLTFFPTEVFDKIIFYNKEFRKIISHSDETNLIKVSKRMRQILFNFYNNKISREYKAFSKTFFKRYQMSPLLFYRLILNTGFPKNLIVLIEEKPSKQNSSYICFRHDYFTFSIYDNDQFICPSISYSNKGGAYIDRKFHKDPEKVSDILSPLKHFQFKTKSITKLFESSTSLLEKLSSCPTLSFQSEHFRKNKVDLFQNPEYYNPDFVTLCSNLFDSLGFPYSMEYVKQLKNLEVKTTTIEFTFNKF